VNAFPYDSKRMVSGGPLFSCSPCDLPARTREKSRLYRPLRGKARSIEAPSGSRAVQEPRPQNRAPCLNAPYRRSSGQAVPTPPLYSWAME